MEVNDKVKQLLSAPFSRLSFAEKQLIIQQDRPTPEIKLSQQKNNGTMRRFHVTKYNEVKWLTGSKELNKLFCWPCLLFITGCHVWNKTGYCDLNNIDKAIKKHEKSKDHINCALTLSNYGHVRIDHQISEHARISVQRHNALVSENRKILERLINLVCTLGKQEVAFRGHDEGGSSFNRGNFVEILEFLAEYDPILRTHLENATVFKGTSNHIQNDLIAAVEAVIDEELLKEISETSFASVMADECNDSANFSQVAISVRYVVASGIKERFLCFVKAVDRRAAGIAKIVLDSVEKYECHNKLVSQSYDGAAVMSGDLNGVQTKVRETHRNAIFIHCYAHCLNLVLADAASNVSECKIFFTRVNRIVSFFSRSGKKNQVLDEIVGRRLPNVCVTRWGYNSRVVNSIETHKTGLIDVFTEIRENGEYWDGSTLETADFFIKTLHDFEFNFLLGIFDEIFSQTDTLFLIMQAKQYDICYCREKIYQAIHNFKEMRANNFDKYYNNAFDQCTDAPPEKRQRGLDNPEQRYKCIFGQIFDHIITQMEERYRDLDELKFIVLLDPAKFEQYKKTFPQVEIDFLSEQYNGQFDIVKLKNELKVVYESPEFQEKYAHDIHRFIIERQLQSCFSEVHKLAELIMTFPLGTANVERAFSSMNRIKTHIRSTMGQDRLQSLAKISIKKQLLCAIKSKPDFYGRVIDHFNKKARRIDLIYK